MDATNHILTAEENLKGMMEIVHRTHNPENAGNEPDGWITLQSLNKKERNALKVIYNHRGKRTAFEFYRRHHPERAMMYLKFVSKYSWAQYIRWDDLNKQFVL